MGSRWKALVAAAIVLALPLGGCRAFRQPYVPPAVGTCVNESETGTPVVPCSEPHTHRVTAVVAGGGDACPADTVMYETPADSDDGLVTTCFALHRVTR